MRGGMFMLGRQRSEFSEASWLWDCSGNLGVSILSSSQPFPGSNKTRIARAKISVNDQLLLMPYVSSDRGDGIANN